MDQTPEVIHPDLRGQSVVITGGAKGIGLATAQAFVRQGARVALLDMDATALDEAVAGLTALGGEALAVQASVTDADAVEQAFAQVEKAWSRIDVLVNNAGVSANKPTLEVTVDEWRRAVDINLTGVFLCAQAAGRRMVPAGAGSIINLASMYGVVAAPDRAAYCATKGAVVLLTETLAVEWGPMGVRGDARAPGDGGTGLVRALAARGRLDPERLKQRTPLRRLAQPAEMADLAVFLASRQAAYVNGHTLVADGGWSRYSYL
ncbi:SDR family NAD(P)-dependent oxidoreductase [Achromobacter aegrifaciens]|uniref:SDR family NAD(P)-dependent oxidoreductase n=1 Tax=Achromobacter aegrifaciens TaxID=1287736 RepID=UPI000F7359BF|nr:SDR family oxidoreductase [Achromobacter aegrifaciens]RSE91512.1 SDR family oxidoreductase [Achromobacter aegrifaciens]